MRKILVLLIFGIIIISGCVSQEDENDDSITGKVIESTESAQQEEEQPDHIEEDSILICPSSCDDGNKCTFDYCNELTDYECKHKTLSPCYNNSICEQSSESSHLVSSPNCGMGSSSGGSSSTSCEDTPAESGYCQYVNQVNGGDTNDCPETCNDENVETEDYYDFDAQECKHYNCIQNLCPSSCDDNNACTNDYCSESTNYECINEPETPCCDNNQCETGETYSNCPQDCKNLCPSSCDDGDSYTFDYCNETTSFQCAHILVDCNDNDGICPVGCTNQDDSDCSIINTIELNYIGSMQIRDNIYVATTPSFVKIYDKANFALINSINVGTTTSSYKLSVDNNHIYVSTNDNSVAVFDKQGNSITILNLQSKAINYITNDDSVLYVAFYDYNIINNKINLTGYISLFEKSDFTLLKTIIVFNEPDFGNAQHSHIDYMVVDNSNIYVNSDYKIISIFNKNDGSLTGTIFDINNRVNGIKIDDDYIYVLDAITQTNTDSIKIFRKSDFSLEKLIPLDWGRWKGIVIDNNYVYVGWVGSDKNILKIWKKADGSFVKTLLGNIYSSQAIPTDVDENHIYVKSSYSSGDSIQIWKK